LQIILKPGCFLIDGKIFMKCSKCEELKERTAENFIPNSDIQNFLTCRAGFESVRNLCKPCFVGLAKMSRKTKEGFVRSLLTSYIKDGLSIKWFWEKLKKQHGCGPISGKTLKLSYDEINCVGIHAYDNDKSHTDENCFLEIQEFNVPQ
jgi:hypothetical protein